MEDDYCNIRRNNFKLNDRSKQVDIDEGKNFKIKGIHLNIRSILKNLDQLKIFVSQQKMKWDYIALTESWANRKDLEDLETGIQGYDSIISSTKYNQNGGIMIYVKKEYKIEEIEID